MPNAYKVLGQINPAATTVTALETVPSLTQVVVSTITVANLAGTGATYRLIVQPLADVSATILNKQYLAYDVTVGANDTTTLTLGITLDAGDVIKVYASTANLAFNAFGSEITA
jgi:hypothetical protein